LGDVEEASRDGLEGPELGEPEALEVDDDERLAYRPAGGGRRGWEDLGEESLDVDEHGAPVLLWRDVSVEPLVAYRAEALDVYRTPELYDTVPSISRDWSGAGRIRISANTRRNGKSKRLTLSVWRREDG
jgi:hypothetical protein